MKSFSTFLKTLGIISICIFIIAFLVTNLSCNKTPLSSPPVSFTNQIIGTYTLMRVEHRYDTIPINDPNAKIIVTKVMENVVNINFFDTTYSNTRILGYNSSTRLYSRDSSYAAVCFTENQISIDFEYIVSGPWLGSGAYYPHYYNNKYDAFK